jgi:hypothetical protein
LRHALLICAHRQVYEQLNISLQYATTAMRSKRQHQVLSDAIVRAQSQHPSWQHGPPGTTHTLPVIESKPMNLLLQL